MKYWLKENLLNRWYNSVLTGVFILLIGILVFFGIRFLFVSGEWTPIRENLTLFMIGRFPRAEQWRILAQIQLITFSIGLIWGIYISMPKRTSAHQFEKSPFWKRYWALGLLLVVLLMLAQSFLPFVFVLIACGSFALAFFIGKLTPARFRGLGQYCAVLCFIISYQILNGTHGNAWIWTGLLTGIAIYRLSNKKMEAAPFWLKTFGGVLGAAIIYGIYQIPAVSFTGVSWEKWSGFHLNLTVTLVALILAIPLGLLLAVGRRSKLPAIKFLSVGYIELIRGVPLIGLLFVGDLFLGFFLTQANSLSTITRAIAVMALFTSAYMAEIFRGGLRAVPAGQIDASKALGLGNTRSFIYVIFPQALRATIPALVGQSISLFKDTSLLTIISVVEILAVREVVHTQEAFLTIGIAETLIFVSFAFWAVSYTMSKESQLLETRLGVSI